MAAGDRIRPTDLALRRGGEPGRLEDLSLEEVEGLLVRKAMERFGGNVSQAAKALGISRSALYRRLEKHG
jgi:transcriptional regulator of acetoin/glycerol metabolism